MPHPIVLGLAVVFALYGLVFLQQILAIRSAKRRVRDLIAGDRMLESCVRDEPAKFLATCAAPEARSAYTLLAERYAGLQRHMLGFFGLAAVLFLAVNIAGLVQDRFEGLALVDVIFALSALLVYRTSDKIGRFRRAVLDDDPAPAIAVV